MQNMPRPISSDVRLKKFWFDYCTPASNWTSENLVSQEIINLVNSDSLLVCVCNIAQNNSLVIVTLDSMENDLVVFHHITQIGGAVQVKEPKIVDLNFFDTLATVVRFKAPGFLFGHIV